MPRVLLVHPTRSGVFIATPHLGCAMLAGVLRAAGHEVLVIDYTCLTEEERTPENVLEIAGGFRPDVIGFSVYTASASTSLDLARRCKERFGVPILVGGVHATLFPERVAGRPYVDTVVCGEAEGIINDIVCDPAALAGRVVKSPPVDVAALPFADFTAIHHAERLTTYPLLVSRGCPFGCSFCPVHYILSRRWRPRPLDAVLEEVRVLQRTLPQVRRVEVHDDCPTADVARFKRFLRQFIEIAPDIALHVANMRADTVDEELLALMKAAGCGSACVAVEHGNETVFKAIGKAETLEEIESAARLIKAAGMRLHLCFVIGLPHDNLKRTADSIRLARRLGPEAIFWNVAHPFPHTKMRQWFEENGATFYPDEDYCSYSEPTFEPQDPIVETPGFTREQRKEARFWAAIETDQYDLRKEGLAKLVRLTLRYGHAGSVLRSLARLKCRGLQHRMRRLVGRKR